MVWICQYIQCTDPLWLQRLMLQDYLTTSKWYVRVTISTLNFAVGVDGNPQPCYFRYLDWGNSIYVMLYMWFTSVINPWVLCVSAYRSRDDTSAQRLDPFGSGRYKMVSEHMLTVGRDPRNWQAHRKDFSLKLYFSKISFTSLLFWAYSNIPF